MSQLSLAEGTLFAGRYQVVRCVAMGGMGAVYEVVHLETERRRALKVMLPHMVNNEDLRNRFRQEARVAAHIDSEHIVDVFDAGVDDETQMPFLVMELLRGEELGKRLQRVGRFHPKDVVTFLHQTSLALDKTHKASIVHRDLKPENLFLTDREDGQTRIKVLDFGIAKLVADSGTHLQATRSLGTPLYMAPEQFRTLPVSPQTDIYSLGMVAYTFLVGTPYWYEESCGDGNVFSFAMLAVNGPPEPATVRARRRGVELPPAFDAWFAQATAPSPTARFRAAGAAIHGLAEILGQSLSNVPEGSGPQIPIITSTGESGPLPESNTSLGAAVTKAPIAGGKGRALLVVGFAVVAMGLGGVGAVVMNGRRAPPSEGSTEVRPAFEGPGAPSAAPVVTPAPTETAAPTSSGIAASPSVSAPGPLASASGAVTPGTSKGRLSSGKSATPGAPTVKIYSRD